MMHFHLILPPNRADRTRIPIIRRTHTIPRFPRGDVTDVSCRSAWPCHQRRKAQQYGGIEGWVMILRVVKAEVSGHHRLRLEFNDATRKTVDVGALLNGPVFEPLRDPAYFARRTGPGVRHGGVAERCRLRAGSVVRVGGGRTANAGLTICSLSQSRKRRRGRTQ
jgi:hypothetical protein